MSRASVLVVDDDADLRDWVANELLKSNFSVERASSGRMALEVQSRQRFDLALIDLRMPGMDGIETLTALKQRDPDIEAVVATGHATVPAAVESMKHGAFDFIQKPYTLRQLLPLLEKALEKSRLQGTVALHEASSSLLGTHQAGELLDQAAEVLKRMLRADSVGITLSHRPSPVWYPGEAGRQADESFVSLIAAQLPAGETAIRLPGSTGDAATIGPFGSGVVASMNARGHSIGALALLRSREQQGFTSEEMRRAVLFADQLALAVDNARLHEELSVKVQEVTKTRDALIFAEKLALTGQLTAGVAHEINTPLTYVRFNLDFVVATADRLVEEMKEGSFDDSLVLAGARQSLNELRTAAADARDGVERIVRIVKDLNMFAQPDRDQKARLPLARVLDWAANVAMPQIRPRARLVKAYSEVPPIHGNETRLGQVFVNLLVNAAQAIPAGHADKHQITVGLRKDGDRVVVDVQDTGAGIDPALLERIFEPFFTTKPLGAGTGLGLPICRSIVTEHGGKLAVESIIGHGTTFHVSLPAAKGEGPVLDRSKVLRA